MKEHDVVIFNMSIKEHGIRPGHIGTIVNVYPNIYTEPQNFEVEIHGGITLTVHRSWISKARPQAPELKHSDFLKNCDWYFKRDGEFVVLCRNFGSFDWPSSLDYAGYKWKFLSQDAMGSDERIYSGKAIYIQNNP